MEVFLFKWVESLHLECVGTTHSEWAGQTYPDRVAEQLEEAEVVSGGEQPAVGTQRGGIDLGDVTVSWPDAFAGGAQDGGPGGPADLLQLHTHIHSPA